MKWKKDLAFWEGSWEQLCFLSIKLFVKTKNNSSIKQTLEQKFD
jgi:hypothetical protein